jgi:hypothetical protein
VKREEDVRGTGNSSTRDPSYQHAHDTDNHGGNRSPKGPSHVAAHLLFLLFSRSFLFVQPAKSEQTLWIGVDTRTTINRIPYQTLIKSQTCEGSRPGGSADRANEVIE